MLKIIGSRFELENIIAIDLGEGNARLIKIRNRSILIVSVVLHSKWS